MNSSKIIIAEQTHNGGLRSMVEESLTNRNVDIVATAINPASINRY